MRPVLRPLPGAVRRPWRPCFQLRGPFLRRVGDIEIPRHWFKVVQRAEEVMVVEAFLVEERQAPRV